MHSLFQKSEEIVILLPTVFNYLIVEGTRYLTSKIYAEISASCWTEIWTWLISRPRHKTQEIAHFISTTITVYFLSDVEESLRLCPVMRVTWREDDESLLNLGICIFLLGIDTLDLFSGNFVAIEATDLAIILVLVKLPQ